MSELPPAARLEKRLGRSMAKAIDDFQMIAEGDKILVAVSGGKDSYTLHHLLVGLGKRAPIGFSLVAVNIDQGHPVRHSRMPCAMTAQGLLVAGAVFTLCKQGLSSLFKVLSCNPRPSLLGIPWPRSWRRPWRPCSLR